MPGSLKRAFLGMPVPKAEDVKKSKSLRYNEHDIAKREVAAEQAGFPLNEGQTMPGFIQSVPSGSKPVAYLKPMIYTTKTKNIMDAVFSQVLARIFAMNTNVAASIPANTVLKKCPGHNSVPVLRVDWIDGLRTLAELQRTYMHDYPAQIKNHTQALLQQLAWRLVFCGDSDAFSAANVGLGDDNRVHLFDLAETGHLPATDAPAALTELTKLMNNAQTKAALYFGATISSDILPHLSAVAGFVKENQAAIAGFIDEACAEVLKDIIPAGGFTMKINATASVMVENPADLAKHLKQYTQTHSTNFTSAATWGLTPSLTPAPKDIRSAPALGGQRVHKAPPPTPTKDRRSRPFAQTPVSAIPHSFFANRPSPHTHAQPQVSQLRQGYFEDADRMSTDELNFSPIAHSRSAHEAGLFAGSPEKRSKRISFGQENPEIAVENSKSPDSSLNSIEYSIEFAQ